ncbi:MAG: hypothetical protein ACOC32_03290 [Nanoarchaeota archaeon]
MVKKHSHRMKKRMKRNVMVISAIIAVALLLIVASRVFQSRSAPEDSTEDSTEDDTVEQDERGPYYYAEMGIFTECLRSHYLANTSINYENGTVFVMFSDPEKDVEEIQSNIVACSVRVLDELNITADLTVNGEFIPTS